MEKDNAIELLKNLIRTPSFSGQEEHTAAIIKRFLRSENVEVNQKQNNIWATNRNYDPNRPTILLNSHHDTVRPNKGWTYDPFEPVVEDDRLIGLGSNDAGASLVSLAAVFLHFYKARDLNYNLIFTATAEEEISGKNGIASLLPDLPKIDFAIVGEPTGMNLAIAEKGLLVIDAYSNGTAGHAAHENGDNPIYNALADINWIQEHRFPLSSDTLGEVKMTVTQINAGQKHNVVPARCDFVIDVRSNEHYSNQEVFDVIDSNTKSVLKARSFRLNSSSISEDHPIVHAGKNLGLQIFGSPTLSDQALMNFPSVKIGPGDSMRSHQADEFIEMSEIEEGIEIYKNLLTKLL